MEHTYKSSDIEFPLQRIEERDMEKEVKTSFIEYSMSVITSRALPDVRDGMKPGQRRILYAMHEDHLTHDKAFRKSATTVGNVLGRYHPHGDAAVYGTMVRMAQDFSYRYPLVEGQGNFGSVDGDDAAAYRYTEARMSRIAAELMVDIEKNVVDMKKNFDNTRDEPTVLPLTASESCADFSFISRSRNEPFLSFGLRANAPFTVAFAAKVTLLMLTWLSEHTSLNFDMISFLIPTRP